MRSAIAIGAAGLLGCTAGGALIAGPLQRSPIPITASTFPREVLGHVRDDAEWRVRGSEHVIERLDAEFEDQRAGHRFAYGGDGASFGYGGVYTLTIVNARLAVTVPTAGDPPAGDIPRVVSFRSAETSCVSQQSILEFERRPPHPQPSTDPEAHAAAGPAAVFRKEGPSVWTDCVFVDQERNVSLRLFGQGPANDTLGTASQFRDELQRIHADLIG